MKSRRRMRLVSAIDSRVFLLISRDRTPLPPPERSPERGSRAGSHVRCSPRRMQRLDREVVRLFPATATLRYSTARESCTSKPLTPAQVGNPRVLP